MKLCLKVLGGQELTYTYDDSTTTVNEVKKFLVTKLNKPLSQIKLVYKGKTLAAEKRLSDYNIQDQSKLHVAVKKTPSSASLKEEEVTPTKPKYRPEELWSKLSEVLAKNYGPDESAVIMMQFRKDYECMLKTLSLDDIERIAEKNLTT